MLTFIKFLFGVGQSKAKKAERSLIQMIAAIDPESASDAQMGAIHQELNRKIELTTKARAAYHQEQQEADNVAAEILKLTKSADHIEAQIADPANAANVPGLQASLGTLVTRLEQLATDHEREAAEALEAKQYLDELEAITSEAADKLKNAKGNLRDAIREMQRAKTQRERAEEKASTQEVLAGLRTENNSMDAALEAFRANAEKDRQAADAANMKARLLKPMSGGDSLENDPNIKAAMAAAAGKPVAASTNDRLAAVRARIAKTATADNPPAAAA